MNALTVVIGWIIALFVGALEAIILWYIVSGRIKLESLISEPNGKASLSRFQFLVFTLVIAVSFLLVVVGQDTPRLPDPIPAGVFALLGISGGSYVISKGIQKGMGPEESPRGKS